MTFFNKIRENEFIRRVVLLARTKWNDTFHSQKIDQDKLIAEEVASVSKEELVDIMALRNYNLAIPPVEVKPGDFMSWERFQKVLESLCRHSIHINRTNGLTKFLSIGTRVCAGSSVAMSLYLALKLCLGYGSYTDTYGELVAFQAFIAEVSNLYLMCGATALIGLMLGGIDSEFTMRLKITEAKKSLSDPKIFHEEKNLLEMEKDNIGIEVQLAEFRKEIRVRIDKIKQFRDIGAQLKGIKNMPKEQRVKDLRDIRSIINKLIAEVKIIKADMRGIEKKIDAKLALQLSSVIMAKAAESRDLIQDLRSGETLKQIERLRERAREYSRITMTKAERSRQELLVDVRLPNDDKSLLA